MLCATPASSSTSKTRTGYLLFSVNRIVDELGEQRLKATSELVAAIHKLTQLR